MDLGSTIKTSLVAATVAVSVLATAAPAEAGSLRRGFMPGLFQGLAIAALAASAQAAQQQGSTIYTVAPPDVESFGYEDQGPPAVISPRQPARRITRTAPRATPRSKAQALQTRSTLVDRCSDALAASSRRLGAVDVDVRATGAGAKNHSGSVDVPIIARIEYARNGRKQTRQARVTCTLNPKGQVVAFR